MCVLVRVRVNAWWWCHLAPLLFNWKWHPCKTPARTICQLNSFPFRGHSVNDHQSALIVDPLTPTKAPSFDTCAHTDTRPLLNRKRLWLDDFVIIIIIVFVVVVSIIAFISFATPPFYYFIVINSIIIIITAKISFQCAIIT